MTLSQMNVLSLCAGIGGLDLAVTAVWPEAHTTDYAEIDPAAITVLAERFGDANNIGDIKNPTAPTQYPDLIAAGFPCQDWSLAGKGAGFGGVKGELWFDVRRQISNYRPTWVVLENVPGIVSRGGIKTVTHDLEVMGYGGAWCYWRSGYRSRNPSRFPHVGGCHQRKRWFLLAHADMGLIEEHQAKAATDDDSTVGSLLPTPSASGAGSNQGGAAGRVGPVRHSLRSIDRLLPTWGDYAPAVERWAQTWGPPPEPAIDTRLNPQLPEWMLGFAPGWVTDLDLARTAQLRLLGNAVQPQTATAALSHLKTIIDNYRSET